MIKFVVEAETKSGRTYRSFQGVSPDDFKAGTPLRLMGLFAVQLGEEEAEQDAQGML